jgi:hypothetical protein
MKKKILTLFLVIIFWELILVFTSQDVSAQIIDLPLLSQGSYDNAGGWGMGNKDYTSYGGVTVYTDDPAVAAAPRDLL